MRKILVCAMALVFLSGLAAFAGDDAAAAAGLPKIIVITREDIRFAKMGTHDALARQVRQTANATNSNFRWVAGNPTTGNPSEYFAVTFADSFAEVEKALDARRASIGSNLQNADFLRDSQDTHTSVRNTIAQLRSDLSYRPEKLDIANARYWEVTFLRFKPGTAREFVEAEKESIELHRKANIEEHWVTYQVSHGAPGNSFVILTALRSLADLDADTKEAHKAAIPAAVSRRFETAIRDNVVYEESTIVAIRPDVSRPPEKIMAANPDFWNVKEPETAVAAKSKKTRGGVQPASMKEEKKQ